MDPILQNIDTDLTGIEERLLGELRRLRKLESMETYCDIDNDLKNELRLTLDALMNALEHSGDASNLSLRTTEHESLQARMEVTTNLTSRKIPTAFIDLSHQEVKAARQKLEFKVGNFRAEKGKTGTRSHDDTSQSPQELARNPDRITRDEEKRFEAEHDYQDKGIYFASRELAVLNQQVALHHEEDQSIEEVIKGRAEFTTRDLSKGHAQDKKGREIAQSPDEIRKKLASRGATTAGASTFTSKDLGGPPPSQEPVEKPSRRRSIAQSPEEIRKKLEERQANPAGKAVFGATDIEPVQTAKTPSKEPEKKPEPEPPAGRAVFGSKDIEPLPTVVRKKEEKKKEEPKSGGKAIFESKDLSNPKP